jgi:hypothetical protein
LKNPETFMGNIEQEWTIQRHSWATLSKNGQSKDIHGQHCGRMDNPETFMGNIEQEWTIQRHSWETLSIKQRTKIKKNPNTHSTEN